MGEILDLTSRIRDKSLHRKTYERLALSAAALTTGAIGTLLVQELTESKPDPALRAEVRKELEQADIKIGNLALSALNSRSKGVHFTENGEWGGPTIIIKRAKSEVAVGMKRVNGQLDPNTTHGVSIFLNKAGVLSPRGEGGVETAFITEDSNGNWQSNAELFINTKRAEVADIHVDETDPNETNTYTLSTKAQEMAHQIIDPLLSEK
jgi:hypothetical protein